MGKPEINTDPDTVKTAGLPRLLTPPTFPLLQGIVVLDLEEFITLLGETIENLLHVEKYFTYYDHIYTGEKITVYKLITDIIEK